MYIPILGENKNSGYIPIKPQNSNNVVSSNNSVSIPAKQKDDGGVLKQIANALLNVGAFIQEKLGATGETLPQRIQQASETIIKKTPEIAKDIFLEPYSRTTASLISRQEIMPQTPVEKFFWGEEPIKPIEQRIKESIPVGGRVGEFLGEKVGAPKTGEFLGKLLAPAVVVGSTILDLTPFGGSKKNLTKQLLKTKTADEALFLLKKAGVADDIAKKYAPDIAKITNEPELKTILSGIENKIKTTSQLPITEINFDKLNQVLKEAKTLRGEQEKIYSAERAKKLAKMVEISKNTEGEKGYIARLAALKGEMKKVDFESIADKFTKEERDSFFNVIWKSNELNEWEKINAAEGLSKILGIEGGRVPTFSELEKLSKVFPEDVIKNILEKRGVWDKTKDYLMQAYNFPRTVMAGTLDLSATLLQNALFAFRHPIITAKNFLEQVKMFGNENYFKTVMNEITQRSNFHLYKKAGIELTDVGPIARLREETFMAPFVEKIPGIGSIVKATGRAWTGFLNKMRADVADKMIENAKILGKDINDEKFLKYLGFFINAATGRGKLGQLEKIAPILSQGFFSARKLAATFQMINPAFYVKADPLVRKEALKTWLAFLGGGTTILGLAKMAGAEVGTDPNSADFGKIKIGNTRFNVFGSYQQLAVLFSRLFSGKMVSSTTGRITELGEGYKPVTRLDIISNFFETKEHPTLSYLIGLLKGTDQIGREFRWQPELLNRFIPMIFADSYDIYKEHGPIGLLGVIPIVLGVPTQTYGGVELVKGKNPLGQEILSIRSVPKIEDILSKKIGVEEPLSPSMGEVQIFYNNLLKLPRDEAARIFDEITEKNPDLAKKILKIHEEVSLGITPEEKLLKTKPVADGSRAKEILKQLNKLKTKEEKAALWEDYTKKGIITKEVAKQLLELLRNGK